MEKEYAGMPDREPTLLERVNAQKKELLIKDDQIDRILKRVSRLEERVDTILGSEPRQAEPEVRGYDRT